MKLQDPQRPARQFQPYLVAEIPVDEAEIADGPVNIPESVTQAAVEKQRTTHRGRPARKLSETEPQEPPEKEATETAPPETEKAVDTTASPDNSTDSEEQPNRDSKPKKKRRGRRGRRSRSKNNSDKPSGDS